MYYGYNDEKKIVLADEEFVTLLGFNSFKELNASSIINNIQLGDEKLIIHHEGEKIDALFLHHEMCGVHEDFYLVELKDVNVKNSNGTAKSKIKALEGKYKAIYLDVDKISKEIGLSVTDYKLYLDSFIDQSIIDESRLLEGNDKVVKNLSNLALTLKIPQINILLLKIQKLPKHERMPLVDEYYTKLVLLTLEKPDDYEEELSDDIFEEDKNKEDKEELLNARFSDLLKSVDTNDEISENIIDEPISNASQVKEEKIQQTTGSSNQLSLDNVPLLSISYDPQTAADELNLPVVLIEEFVYDFIEQARQDKEHLLTSFHQKDLENIHELGHKLKGAASNLRINELSDILEEIQFCSDYTRLESLFTEYWGHFLALEEQMNQRKNS